MKNVHKEIIEKYFMGSLSSDEQVKLNEILDGDIEARNFFRLMATIDEGLAEKSEGPLPLTHNQNFRFHFLVRFMPWAISAAAAVIIFFLVNERKSLFDEIDKTEKLIEQPFVAKILNQVNSKFTAGMTPVDSQFGIGKYELEKGIAHIRFSNGADLFMSGSVRFDIKSDLLVVLHRGNVRAVVPAMAKGFTISSQGVNYVDLGTEFGLSVDGETGVSKLHVFDGQVNVRDPGSKTLLSEVTEGQTVKYANGTIDHLEMMDTEIFIEPGSIGFLRWRQNLGRIISDPDVIAYFSFDSVESESSIFQEGLKTESRENKLKNLSENSIVSDGNISNARWVTGRWPEKKALLFDRNEDFVELDITGEFDELTFSSWVKIDRRDKTLSPIFNSDGWSVNDVNWQISRPGHCWIGSHGPTHVQADYKYTTPINKWINLVAVISSKQMEARSYLNGKVISLHKLKNKFKLSPGKSRLGGWNPEGLKTLTNRALRGRMDEFCIWKRALSESDIRGFLDGVQPVALWQGGSFEYPDFKNLNK